MAKPPDPVALESETYTFNEFPLAFQHALAYAAAHGRSLLVTPCDSDDTGPTAEVSVYTVRDDGVW